MRALVPALALALVVASPAPAAAQDGPAVLVVSRAEVLETSRAARALAEEERRLTARLQREIDAIKADLAREEEELARLRPEMSREAFEVRAEAFRRRVQRERRDAQRRSATLQGLFRDARERLVDALGPILEEVRARRGADVIVNAETVLAAAGSADVTGAVLALFDARVDPPEIALPEDLDPANWGRGRGDGTGAGTGEGDAPRAGGAAPGPD